MKIPFGMSAVLCTLLMLFASVSLRASQAGFSALSVTITGDDVKVAWTVSPEASKPVKFEVEVATEATAAGELDFKTIGEVEAQNNTRYEFVDKSSSKQGILYYRVRQMHENGRVTFSQTATANFANQESFTLNVSPDATFGKIELGVNANKASTATVTVSCVSCDYTKTQNVTVTRGITHYVMQLDPEAPNGPYLFTFELNGDVQQRLLMKEPTQDILVNN